LHSGIEHTTSNLDLDAVLLALREQQMPMYKSRFLVKQGQRLVPIEIQDIAYFYTEDKVSFIKTFSDQRFVVDYSLDELEQLLNPVQFFRANRQYIIAPKTLESIHNHFNGKLKVILKPAVQQEVYISRERAADFKVWLGE
jgi:two-component system LytT family response regulator